MAVQGLRLRPVAVGWPSISNVRTWAVLLIARVLPLFLRGSFVHDKT
jgi:hypothetical protein